MTLTWHPAILKEVSGCLENYITHLKSIIFVKRVAVVACNIHSIVYQEYSIVYKENTSPSVINFVYFFSFTRFTFIVNYLEGK